MAKTGYSSFDTTVDKTNHILNQIEEAYGWSHEHRNQSYAALRGVLHALRDRLTVEEAAQFSAQLPLLVRGVFYDGWDPSRAPKKLSKDDFLERVRKESSFEVKGGPEGLVRTVVKALRTHITEGEWRDVLAGMPKDLVTILSE